MIRIDDLKKRFGRLQVFVVNRLIVKLDNSPYLQVDVFGLLSMQNREHC